jgi:hypothetical protein
MSSSTAARRFVGVWRLEAIRDRLPDGREQDHSDFGPGPDGFLVYTDSGHVSVQFMRRDRVPWQVEDDPTDAERANALAILAETVPASNVEAKGSSATRRDVLEDLFWAVLTDREFLFNH